MPGSGDVEVSWEVACLSTIANSSVTHSQTLAGTSLPSSLTLKSSLLDSAVVATSSNVTAHDSVSITLPLVTSSSVRIEASAASTPRLPVPSTASMRKSKSASSLSLATSISTSLPMTPASGIERITIIAAVVAAAAPSLCLLLLVIVCLVAVVFSKKLRKNRQPIKESLYKIDESSVIANPGYLHSPEANSDRYEMVESAQLHQPTAGMGLGSDCDTSRRALDVEEMECGIPLTFSVSIRDQSTIADHSNDGSKIDNDQTITATEQPTAIIFDPHPNLPSESGTTTTFDPNPKPPSVSENTVTFDPHPNPPSVSKTTVTFDPHPKPLPVPRTKRFKPPVKLPCSAGHTSSFEVATAEKIVPEESQHSAVVSSAPDFDGLSMRHRPNDHLDVAHQERAAEALTSTECRDLSGCEAVSDSQACRIKFRSDSETGQTPDSAPQVLSRHHGNRQSLLGELAEEVEQQLQQASLTVGEENSLV